MRGNGEFLKPPDTVPRKGAPTRVVPLAEPIVLGRRGKLRIVGVMSDAPPDVVEKLATLREAA